MENWLILQSFYNGVTPISRAHVDAAASRAFLSLTINGATALIEKMVSNQGNPSVSPGSDRQIKVLDGFRIDSDAFSRNDMPKIDNLRKLEFTLGELGIETMFTKLEEKEVEMFFVFFVGNGKDRDVVEIDHHELSRYSMQINNTSQRYLARFMKCSYTEVFAIASVNKTQVIDTSYAYWKKNKMNKNLMEEKQHRKIPRQPKSSLENVNVVTTTGGKSTRDPPNPNDTGKAKERQETEPSAQNKEREEEMAQQEYTDTSFLPFPTHTRKSTVDEQFARFVEIIQKIHVSVPLMDVLHVPSYAHDIKDIINNKRPLPTMEVITLLTEECRAAILNQLP
ncbi:hypothetical protein ACQ4PT_064895 [Festuca glaucescens]